MKKVPHLLINANIVINAAALVIVSVAKYIEDIITRGAQINRYNCC